jgi:hypothetical protein
VAVDHERVISGRRTRSECVPDVPQCDSFPAIRGRDDIGGPSTAEDRHQGPTPTRNLGPFSRRAPQAPETGTAQEHGGNDAKWQDSPVAERVADIAEEEHQQPGSRESSDEKYKDGKQDGSNQWLSLLTM